MKHCVKKHLIAILNWKYDGYLYGLTSMGFKNEFWNKELTDQNQSWKIHCFHIDSMWGVDLADMQLISKFNKGFILLFCVIDIYSKYAWVIPLKDKKELQLLMLFQEF